MKFINNGFNKTINKKNFSLKLFKFETLYKNFFKSTTLWNGKLSNHMLFKSFFVFLKTKPFIIKMRYNLLTYFHMNPRPYTLSSFILKTKQFKTNSINLYFNFSSQINFISKKKLFWYFFKTTNRLKKKLFFNFFKYKLFSYTTPKKYNRIALNTYSHLFQLDFRTNLINLTYKHSFPNVTTISTYNWKVIN